MIRSLLMDFNGVVIDDEPIQMEAYREVMAPSGIELTEEQYYACLGKNDDVFVRTIFEGAGKEVSDEEVVRIVDAKSAKWRELIDENVPLFDGVKDFIKRMKNSFAIGLVSMARRQEIDHVLERTGLAGCFEVIVSAEDVSTVKPDPECYKKGFLLLDEARTAAGGNPLTRRQCVVIEDAPQGISAGKGARLKTLGVTNTVSADDLRAAGADAVTHSLKDWNADSFRNVFV